MTLQLDPRNARRHSETNKRRIKQSLDAVGAGRSVLADADGIIRAGRAYRNESLIVDSCGIMVNPKSLANLEKGRKSKHKRNSGGGKTWAALIREYGETIAPDKFTVQVGMDANSTWRQVVVAAAYRNAAAGNAPILKELMQRSEPQPLTHLDLSKLNAEQLERIASGEDPAIVLATSSTSGAGT